MDEKSLDELKGRLHRASEEQQRSAGELYSVALDSIETSNNAMGAIEALMKRMERKPRDG